MVKAKPLCIECKKRPKRKGVHRCSWCWLARQPIETQVRAATARRRRAEATAGFEYRARVPQSEWPRGGRWCSGCQGFVPDEYVRGTRCRAHASQAAHASHVAATYNTDEAEYQALLEWQDGRCYVCGKVPRVRRLAVDHDHRTGAVRGLLCANDDWGCNKALAVALNDVDVARRLLAYVERSPLERMRSGEPPVQKQYRRSVSDRTLSAVLGPAGRAAYSAASRAGS